MTFRSPACSTAMAPTWPSGAGRTANSAGVTGCEAQPAASAAARTTARNLAKAILGSGGGRLVDLDHELGAADAHDRRRRADFHGFRRLLHHLSGHRGEAPLAEGALELAGVGGR